MNVGDADTTVSSIAAAIGEPARARMLYCLIDGRARTSTELAVVAQVSPSTASVHLQRLKTERLVTVAAQGKHRYYALGGPEVAAALEALNVLVAGPRTRCLPNTPHHLRSARRCYDHIAGALGVSLLDRFVARGWLSGPSAKDAAFTVTEEGATAFDAVGIDVEATRSLRRRFAFACLDWSERRPHLGGALGAAVMHLALRKRWLAQDLDSRVLRVTRAGRTELPRRLGVHLPPADAESARANGRSARRG